MEASSSTSRIRSSIGSILHGGATLGLMPSREAIMTALEAVIDPELHRSVIELDMVRGVEIDGGHVALTIALTTAGCPLRSSFETQVEQALGTVGGVEEVTLGFTVMTAEERATLTTKLRGGVEERTPGISVDATTRVIAVASGKGGVGKSSLSANLAAAFSTLGLKTGILDADVYGYSIPHMLGSSRRRSRWTTRMIVPPVRGDLKVMSIGFFLEKNAPVMWRGPMLHRALEQFLSDVHWGELDVLVVDMPPGTGDVAISLGQLLPRAEALVVTTPQGPPSRSRCARRRWRGRRTCGCSASSRTWRTSSARARSSLARAAARLSPRRSRRRSWRGSRSTRGWARTRTRASRSSGGARRGGVAGDRRPGAGGRGHEARGRRRHQEAAAARARLTRLAK